MILPKQLNNKGRKVMTEHIQTQKEFETHLNEQIGFLIASTDSFDKGSIAEAKRIALAIRILVYDTKNSTSLLTHLEMLKSTKFWDTCQPYLEGNLASHSGLIIQSIENQGHAKYMAFLDDFNKTPSQKDFYSWWNDVVFIDSKKQKMSRKDLVLNMTNKDGGAHIDKAIKDSYADLSRGNSLGWEYQDGENSFAMQGAEGAAVRQIGHEILKTLVPSYTKIPTYPETSLQFGAVAVLTGEDATRFARENFPSSRTPLTTNKIGRNQECPCGSQTKYKHCCGR